MPKIEPGSIISVPCSVSPGPFPDELLVTIETVDGSISGFVSEEQLNQSGDESWSVRCQVRAVEKDSISVWIRGSFFTTNGIAHVSSALARAA